MSRGAAEAGYLPFFCRALLLNLDKSAAAFDSVPIPAAPGVFSLRFVRRLSARLPGDARTKIGFLTFDSTVHFYNLQEGLSQPQMLVVSDIDGAFPPPPPRPSPEGPVLRNPNVSPHNVSGDLKVLLFFFFF